MFREYRRGHSNKTSYPRRTKKAIAAVHFVHFIRLKHSELNLPQCFSSAVSDQKNLEGLEN